MSYNSAPIVIFESTFELFKQKFREGNQFAYHALVLYQEYTAIAIRRGNRQIEATENFIRNKEKGMGLSERQYKGAKSLLREMGRVSNTNYNKKTHKHYFTVFIDPKTKEYQDYLSRKFTEIRSDKTDEIRSDTTSPQYKDTTRKQYKDTINKDSKESNCASRKIIRTKDGKLKIIKSSILAKKKTPVQPTTLSSQSAKSESLPKIKRRTIVDDIDDMSCDPFKKDKIAKPKHNYTLSDFQLYNALVSLGATNHRQDTKAYFMSMDMIHELNHPAKHRPPFALCKKVPDDYKKKEWTQEEITETFKFYLADSEKAFRAIHQFIFVKGFDNPSFSSLVIFHSKMLKSKCTDLSGGLKTLNNDLERRQIKADLDARDMKAMLKFLDLYTNGYRIPQHLNHLYYDEPIYALTEYLEEKMRNVQFHMYYAKGEKFYKQFVQEMVQRGVFVRDH